jgi:hypothetical protein
LVPIWPKLQERRGDGATPGECLVVGRRWFLSWASSIIGGVRHCPRWGSSIGGVGGGAWAAAPIAEIARYIWTNCAEIVQIYFASPSQRRAFLARFNGTRQVELSVTELVGEFRK